MDTPNDEPIIANRADDLTNKMFERYKFLRDEIASSPVDYDNWQSLSRLTGEAFDAHVDRMMAFDQAHK